MVQYISDDLFNTDAELILHGVNAQGRFASGIAKQMKEKFPIVAMRYFDRHKDQGWKIGDTQFNYIGDRIIVNACSQQYYGYDGQQYVSYLALYKIFTDVFSFAVHSGIKKIAMPKIGAGLGGGDWSVIEGILIKCLSTRDIEVYIYTGEKRDG